MDLLDLMDALQVHAAAAATAAAAANTGGDFTDVAVGFSIGKGRSVRIFYAGETEPEHFPDDRTLNSKLVGQAVMVRAAWPTPSTGVREQRLLEGEIGYFVKDFRTRVLADSQLGGEGVDLELGLAQVEQVVISDTKYTIADMRAEPEYDEFPLAP